MSHLSATWFMWVLPNPFQWEWTGLACVLYLHQPGCVWLIQNGNHSDKNTWIQSWEHTGADGTCPNTVVCRRCYPVLQRAGKRKKRLQTYFIISRNNSNLVWLRRHRTLLGITWESFWNKTGNVDHSDPPNFQTKMKKRRPCLIRAQNFQVNIYENLQKNFSS